jgi:hypothetical protein
MARNVSALIASLPAPALTVRLARCVALDDFERGTPPSYLFTSRRRNRCNPDGVESVYFSVGEKTASLEYDRYWTSFGSQFQPKLTFFADLSVAHAIDLEDVDVRGRLGVTDDDLFGGWLRRRGQTRLQRLGLAISRQGRAAAIRYPSAAAHARGAGGANVVVFRMSLQPPDSLVILGPRGKVLERWP